MKVNLKNKKKLVVIFLVVVIIIAIISTLLSSINDNTKKTVKIKNIIGKTATKKVIKVKDANGDIFFLPKGFKISEDISEQTVENGLVIIDDTNDKQTSDSEFVWIPVDNSNKKTFDKNFNNKLGNMYRTIDYSLLEEGGESEEYLKIRNSIYKYGGFYIARYEAGINDKMYAKLQEEKYMDREYIIKNTSDIFGSGKYKPVSKQDTIVWNNISWGGTFEEKGSDGFAGNDNKSGAVKVARNMYNSFNLVVQSTLCYGMQWEAIVNFIDECYSSDTCEETSVIVNSSGRGNNYGKLQKTGFDNEFFQKNIADISGNVWEWTMEGYNSMYRIARGGAYTELPDTYSICGSKEFYPDSYFKDIGFRVALYIK